MTTVLSSAEMESTSAELESIRTTYRIAVRRATEQFGEHSKGVYLVTFMSVLAAFELHCRTLRGAADVRATVESAFDYLRSQLAAEFVAMTASTAPDRRESATMFRGRRVPRFHSRGDEDEVAAGRAVVAGEIVTLQQLAASLGSSGVYLYCVNTRGDVIVFRHPLDYGSMLRGQRHGDVFVKHPMLVDDGEPVLCAGEVFVSWDRAKKQVAGVFVTPASGHYQPTSESERAARESVMSSLELEPVQVRSLLTR